MARAEKARALVLLCVTDAGATLATFAQRDFREIEQTFPLTATAGNAGAWCATRRLPRQENRT